MGWVLGAIGAFFYFVPRPVYVLCVRILAAVLRTLQLREDVIRQNLERAFPAESPARREERVRETYLHLAQLVLETFMVFGPMRKLVTDRIVWNGVENWRAAVAGGKGAFYLSSHTGNWEVMVCGGGYAQKMDLLMVTKKLKPAWFHRAFEQARARCEVKGTYEPRTLRDVFGHLKAGKTVGFVLDQYTGPPVSVRVPFFGVRVGTSSALATLVRRTQAPVVPVVTYRIGPLGSRRYAIDILPALPWISGATAEEEILANTAAYAQQIEADVRAHPEQWLWSHRRFKGELS